MGSSTLRRRRSRRTAATTAPAGSEGPAAPGASRWVDTPVGRVRHGNGRRGHVINQPGDVGGVLHACGAARRRVVQIVFHHVCDGCNELNAVTPATLQAFLEWLAPRSRYAS